MTAISRLAAVDIKKEKDPKSLVGTYFHSFGEDCSTKWQGVIVAEPTLGIYLVELFSWLDGSSTNECLVRIDDMLDWYFYDSSEWMNNCNEQKANMTASEYKEWLHSPNRLPQRLYGKTRP